MPTAIESFCGAGGMALGLSRAGFDVRLSFDIDPPSIGTHQLNHASPAVVADAREMVGADLLSRAGIGFGELDVFSGGPPCQGFSKQRKGAHLLDDPRNVLVREFARLVDEIMPRSFLFENVEVFGQKRGRGLIAELAGMLPDYAFHEFFVSGSDFGIAQARLRFLLIGIRRDVSAAEPVLEMQETRVTVRDAICDLPPPPDDCTEHPGFPNHLKCRINRINETRISHVPQGGGWRDIPWDLRLPCHRMIDVSKGGWPDVYGRLSWDGQCPTITGGFDSFSRGRYAHPEQNRAITPREAARLQGFPDAYRFAGTRADVRRQIGNAVPPPLARAAGEAIRRVLDGDGFLPARPLRPRNVSSETRHPKPLVPVAYDV
jgi:DNA (cytosine-5)-methyltransferase 1